MFNSKTLFIVGAGASKEAGLPIGNELAAIISKLLFFEFEPFGGLKHGDHRFFANMQRHFGDKDILNNHLKAARVISEGIHRAGSIDNYIDTHRKNSEIELCGKAAIVHSVLNAEMKSSIHVEDHNRDETNYYQRLMDSWYSEFSSILFERRSLSDIENIFDNISIICFNYDRCIERFLVCALQPFYSISQERSEELVSTLRIYHPYGTVGALPSKQIPFGVSFGCDPSEVGFDLFELASGIKTYTEQVEDKDVLQGIKGEVASAETLVFLGFAFHPQNMELLTPEEMTGHKRIFATALNISDQDSVVVRKQALQLSLQDGRADQLSDRNYPDIQIRNDLGCCDLFRNYRRRLSLI